MGRCEKQKAVPEVEASEDDECIGTSTRGAFSRISICGAKMLLADGTRSDQMGTIISAYSPCSGCLYMFDASRPIKLEVVRGSILHVIGLHDSV